MTDDEARALLKTNAFEWIDWDDETNRPRWDEDGEIGLDGSFTADQLRALLHFTSA